MSKKKNPQVKKETSGRQNTPSTVVLPALIPVNNFWIRVAIIALTGLAFYYNSFRNQTALDDEPVITKNDFVKEGFGGIDSIFSNDAFFCFYRSLGVQNQLAGGRYRPLSIATFAIEWEFFGDDPYVRHVVNVLLYILSVVLLLYTLEFFLFKNLARGPDLAFLCAFLFLIHPIHTEVVANTKSRDEILSFLFLVLTLLFVLRFFDTRKIKWIIFGMIGYFCALLSKEWGITMIFLIPVALFVFRKADLTSVAFQSLPYVGVAIMFLLIRKQIVAGFGKEETELLNNPYILADASEKMGTKLFVLLKYMGLLFFPYPLSSDYNFETIPYRGMGDLFVIFSILLHVGALILAIKLLIKRHPLSFAILFYLGHLALVSNFFFPIGATMGERLIYHSSFGFVMIVAYLLLEGVNRICKKRIQVILCLAPCILLLIPSFLIVTERNRNWYNDMALFTHDVKVVPNSAWMNGNAGRQFIVRSDSSKTETEKIKNLDTSLVYLQRAVKVHPGFVNAWFYMGSAYFRKDKIDSSEYCWNEARKYFPNHPQFRVQFDPILSSHYVKLAETLVKENKYKEAIPFLQRALKYSPGDAEMWYNLGGLAYSVQDTKLAYEAWSNTVRLNPNHEKARSGLSALPKPQ